MLCETSSRAASAGATIGAPRCFDPKAASGYLPRLYRFVNKGDLVPTTPPAFTLPWYRYAHSGSMTVTLDAERQTGVHEDPRILRRGFGERDEAADAAPH